LVFKDPTGLYSTLRSIFEDVITDDTEGSALRDLYSDFLEEASAVTGSPVLKEASSAYRAAAAGWRDFAEAALPENIPAFAETKALMRQRKILYQQQSAEMQNVSEKLLNLQRNLNQDFPMNNADTEALLGTLQAKLNAVYAAEVEALEVLKSAV